MNTAITPMTAAGVDRHGTRLRTIRPSDLLMILPVSESLRLPCRLVAGPLPANASRFCVLAALEIGARTRLVRHSGMREPFRRWRGRTGTVRPVRIATWNVNSVKQRVPRLLPWLDERQPDVVCLQETKLADDAFIELLGEELARRAYAVAVHGQATWNGVAILSRVGLDGVVMGLAGAPGFPHPESRAVSATCGGIRVVSVYVPNGRVPGSEHYRYKLAWLASLREMVAGAPEATVVCGDFNVAPTDDDVFDAAAYVGQTHVTGPERAALAELQALGLRDVVRERWPKERVFTYWDYRAGMFHQDLGMRIDLVLATETVASRVRAAWVDRHARKGTGPSDHAPVIVDLDEAPDGDIGPVVPPPSARAAGRGARKPPQAP
jgi:exodeoxyribonuclease-3